MLSGPRLHFSGSFIADVATVNNRIENFDVSSFVSHRALNDWNGGNGGYNPPGTNGFMLKDVTVKRVCYKEGKCSQDVADDSIIGRNVQGKLNLRPCSNIMPFRSNFVPKHYKKFPRVA